MAGVATEENKNILLQRDKRFKENSRRLQNKFQITLTRSHK
jgi:hypothetical protein